MSHYHTKVVVIGRIRYCMYCGKEARMFTEYEDYHPYDYYNCNCEMANLENQRNIEIKEVESKYSQLIKINHKKLHEIQYKNDLKKLENDYNNKINHNIDFSNYY